MQITANWSRSKSEVEFQYGGPLYFETGSSYISAANGDISIKFGLVIDFDILKAVTSTNMRWSLAMQPYRYTVKYIRGSENVVADYLSRSN